METNIEEIRKLIPEQYQKFNESRKSLTDMLLTEDTHDDWIDNYHLIDHDWIVSWKDFICFEDLEEKNPGGAIVDVSQYYKKLDSKKKIS